MRKQILLVVLAFVCAFAQAQPQPGGERKKFSPEQFKKDLEQFVTKEAELTQEEATKFFPMLHELMDRQRRNGDLQRDLMHSCNANSTEAQYQRALEKSINCELANKKLEKDYLKKFNTVLSWNKIYRVRMALNKFQRTLLRRFAPPGDGPQNRKDRKNNR